MKTLLPDLSSSEDNFSFEKYLYSKGFLHVAGCDEVGRGPLAGPVVAACVILPKNCNTSLFLDSKVLSHKKRLQLKDHLVNIQAKIGLGFISESEIDRINILQASLLAMKLAAQNINGPAPDFLLVDGKFEIPLQTTQKALIKGESKSASIAAASIVAKVARDDLMVKLHDRYPLYNFKKNKGYPTKEHRQALKKFGPSPVHRTTFKGVREYAKQEPATG